MAAFLGIDLGTTNTVAAVFDGETIELVRTPDGATLTPSVVRIDGKGRLTVGARAHKLADRDPDNTHGAFKRLMGTTARLAFPDSGASRSPEELSAEILRSVRDDVREQFGFVPDQAVITVPALFELPQATATSAAARLAGFAHVELIQEPVASALALGWSPADEPGAWLVYDLGGGTFDASVLDTREGLLRVIGHDGDNFLGGRDIDQAIVRWVLARLGDAGHPIDRADRAHTAALRVLRTAAEDAKIALTRAAAVPLTFPGLFLIDHTPIDVDLTLDRATLDALTAPVVDRSIAVCRRLLAAHGLAADAVRRVVLVGGPTLMPVVRQRVEQALGAPLAAGIDPMSLVARGAALYAATAGLGARRTVASTAGERSGGAQAEAGRRLWLEYPAMTPDPSPFVVGRVLDGPEPAPAEVRFVRADGGFTTAWVPVGAEGTLMAMVELVERRANTFAVEGRDRSGAPVALVPATIAIASGLTLSDPPLSRSVGIALAGDVARTYLERGTPLPAKRTYVHQAVETVRAGSDATVLQIPIIQGELREARLCRLVGWFRISGAELRETLPQGADVEVTIDVDRGGRLSARALIPSLGQAFEQVAFLSIPDADPAALSSLHAALTERTAAVRAAPVADPASTDRLVDVTWALADAGAALDDARAGDVDAAQRVRRLLIEADAALGEVEAAVRWPVLDERARTSVLTAARWVQALGTEYERRTLDEVVIAMDRARRAHQAEEMDRHLGTIDALTNAAYFRHPDAWRWQFDHVSSDLARSTDLPRARALVDEGRAAIAAGDQGRLREVVTALYALRPAASGPSAPGYTSGLR